MNFYLTGGTEGFRKFVQGLCGPDDRLLRYDDPEEVPENDRDGVYFLLPRYEAGRHSIPELSFEKTEGFLETIHQGGRFYFENLTARDNCRRRLTGLQTMGNYRHLFKECILYDGMILQARKSYYFPGHNYMKPEKDAVLSDCTGTHSMFREGNSSYPVLHIRAEGRCAAALMNFSQFDSRFMRPYAGWRCFFVSVFSKITGKPEEIIRKAFEAAFPEYIKVSGNSDPEYAVRKALAWHERSGLLRKADGSLGIYEMIQSNGLDLRMNLRTDSCLLTGALFAAAGRKYRDPRMSSRGRTLAEYLIGRGIQLPNGLFKWMDHTNMIWASDSARDGLAVINLYKVTGDEKYLRMAEKLGDAFLDWLGDEAICCGFFEWPNGFEGRDRSDNPVFYGEMVSFLMQLPDEKYHDLALRILDRISRKFPDVTPFGFSDNFTYASYLFSLACVQYASDRDYSDKINHLLDFFENLQDDCGGIRECAIRLGAHPVEAGVAVGDGSDSIADLLYCVNYVFIALSVIVKLPLEKTRSVNMDKAHSMYEKIRNFLLRIQISSPFAELDGGWMRAFDMQLNEYYGLNLDMDWGAYCIMGGWVMSFIPLVFLCEDSAESFFFRTDIA